jgi:hypothetical protein
MYAQENESARAADHSHESARALAAYPGVVRDRWPGQALSHAVVALKRVLRAGSSRAG